MSFILRTLLWRINDDDDTNSCPGHRQTRRLKRATRNARSQRTQKVRNKRNERKSRNNRKLEPTRIELSSFQAPAELKFLRF